MEKEVNKILAKVCDELSKYVEGEAKDKGKKEKKELLRRAERFKDFGEVFRKLSKRK